MMPTLLWLHKTEMRPQRTSAKKIQKFLLRIWEIYLIGMDSQSFDRVERLNPPEPTLKSSP